MDKKSITVSDLGLHCLHMSHKEDAMFILVNKSSTVSDLPLHCLPMSRKEDDGLILVN